MGCVCLSFEQVLALPEVLFYIFWLQCVFWMVSFLDQPSCTVWVEKVGLYLYHIGCSQLQVVCGQRCGVWRALIEYPVLFESTIGSAVLLVWSLTVVLVCSLRHSTFTVHRLSVFCSSLSATFTGITGCWSVFRVITCVLSNRLSNLVFRLVVFRRCLFLIRFTW